MHSLFLQYKQLLSCRESLLIKHFDLLAVIRIGGNFMGVRGVEWGMSITIAQVLNIVYSDKWQAITTTEV